MAKKNTINTYPDSVVVRLHNKRIIVKEYKPEQNGSVVIEMTAIRDKMPTEEQPATRVLIHKNKAITTGIRYSREAAEALYMALHYYLQKPINPLKQTMKGCANCGSDVAIEEWEKHDGFCEECDIAFFGEQET